MLADDNTIKELLKSKCLLKKRLQGLIGEPDSFNKRVQIEDELHFVELVIHLSKIRNH